MKWNDFAWAPTRARSSRISASVKAFKGTSSSSSLFLYPPTHRRGWRRKFLFSGYLGFFFLRSSAMCQKQTCFFYLAPIRFCCWLVSLWPGPLVIFHYIKPLLHMLGRICVSSWIFKRVWGRKCHNQSGRKKETPPRKNADIKFKFSTDFYIIGCDNFGLTFWQFATLPWPLNKYPESTPKVFTNQ